MVVEDSDHQPAGALAPGQRVQIGAAPIKQRAVWIVVMTVNDVAVHKPVGKAPGIAFGEQRRLALLIERDGLVQRPGIDIDRCESMWISRKASSR